MAIPSLLKISIAAIALATSCQSFRIPFPGCDHGTDATSISSQSLLGGPAIKFDYSRIANYHDQETLGDIKEYFAAFVNGDPETLRDLEAPEYTITDIPLAIVRMPREQWYYANKAFTGLTDETQVVAISIYGSSAPKSFVIMENVIWFKLTGNPPPGALDGYKKGDTVGMIMLSAIWWNEGKKVIRELEYGRMTWDHFDIDAFNQRG